MAVELIALTASACDRLRAKATRRVIRDTGSRSLFLIVVRPGRKVGRCASGAPTVSQER